MLQARVFFRAILSALPALSLVACAPAEDTLITGSTMGTSYTVRVAECPLTNCVAQLEQKIAVRLDELTAALSHYEAASDISEFNRGNATAWTPVAADLVTVVMAALATSALTNGAFDATVLPAVRTWGFGPQTDPPQTLPLATDIARSASAVGYLDLEARLAPPALRKLRSTVQLDLSGIAKGYAADQLGYLLETEGIGNYLIEIGGELRVAGIQTTGKPWRIGIETPSAASNATRDSAPSPTTLGIEYIIAPGDAGVATSGDYRNFYWLEEQRVAHTIDPRTARPVTHGLAGVTVIAPSATDADALATALMVMGPIAGQQFASEHALATLFFIRNAGQIDVWMTDEFQALLISSD